jgi:hypothetical protein
MRFESAFIALLMAPAAVVTGQTVVPSPADQIAAAVLPLPTSMQAGAGVRGYSPSMKMVTLRAGTNSMMCTADRPGDEFFDVRCYDRAFLAAIDQWRELAAGGLDSATAELRFADQVRTGAIRLPAHPTAGYRMLGPIGGYDPRTGAVTEAIEKWQSIHFPYRTAAELGLPVVEEGTMPFVMASGTWWAHVMIVHKPST